ncbi:rRNA maturation RNase YbeY [Carboxylicivirga taeanensis]|uniref:rRNA maturation RNase YbeY n=1 Tax=Carboxylicivirga taeanensis TaxID=1416875 RepID=UPI003F6E16AA
MINFISQDVPFPSQLNAKTSQWVEQVIKNSGYLPGEITCLFCSDQYIIDVNRQYLDHDYYTDIITFDYCKNNIISGDLVISLDTVTSNSQQFNSSFEQELHRVIIHGILHLIGYKDSTDTEKAEMRAQEDQALSLLSTFH